jgi:hypothetical protein
MTSPRRSHTATRLPNGKVLVAGGGAGDDEAAVADLYDPSTGIWTPTGALNFPRSLHTATLMANGRVLVAGGWSVLGVRIATAEVYDATTGAWTQTGQLNPARVYHTATLLLNAKLLVAGGYVYDSALSNTELYVETTPFNLVNSVMLPSGTFQFGFASPPGLGFTVLVTTNPSLAISNWTALGGVTEVSPGQFRFKDPQTTNNSQRFYRVQAN